jgi:uncharacterized protein CbrC (UPF0167 family)
MGKAKGFLDEIRTMHAHELTGVQEVEKDWYQRCWDLMALLGIRTKEDIKDERTKEDNKDEPTKEIKDDKIKLKEVVKAWEEKMKNKKVKKSGTAEGQETEGQEKKDKKRTSKGVVV